MDGAPRRLKPSSSTSTFQGSSCWRQKTARRSIASSSPRPEMSRGGLGIKQSVLNTSTDRDRPQPYPGSYHVETHVLLRPLLALRLAWTTKCDASGVRHQLVSLAKLAQALSFSMTFSLISKLA